MVYIALGVLAASLSFLVYTHGFSRQPLVPNQRSWTGALRKLGLLRGDPSPGDGSTVNDVAGVEHDATATANKAELDVDIRLSTPASSSSLSRNGEPSNHHASLPSLKVQQGEYSKVNPMNKPGNAFDNGPVLPPGFNTFTQRQLSDQKKKPSPSPPDDVSTQNPSRQNSSTLMAPPPSSRSSFNSSTPRPSSKISSALLQPPPSAASAQRLPPSRTLAPRASSSSSLAPSTSTLAPSKRPSKKVLLDPGHSPLDWAYLVHHPPTPTFLRGASVPPHLVRVSPSMLRYHNGRKGKDAWGVWQGRVYNLSPYMKFHPGGVDELMKAAGREKDGERLFLEIHPWVSWESMLGECLVGMLVGENDVLAGDANDGSLEDID